jgi:hypothetical protein
LGAKVEFGGARVVGDEAFFFALVEGVKFGAVDGSHGSRKPKNEKRRNGASELHHTSKRDSSTAQADIPQERNEGKCVGLLRSE